MDNEAVICGVQTKQPDSANRKIQLCCGKQMLFHKNKMTLILSMEGIFSDKLHRSQPEILLFVSRGTQLFRCSLT